MPEGRRPKKTSQAPWSRGQALRLNQREGDMVEAGAADLLQWNA